MRRWLAEAGETGEARVHHIVTIGTPHRGTWLARFSHLANGRQMRHDCDWQKSLVARELVLHPQRNADRFVCWYSNTDNIVFPASTATLPGADNRLIRGAGHVDLAFVRALVSEGGKVPTSAGEALLAGQHISQQGACCIANATTQFVAWCIGRNFVGFFQSGSATDDEVRHQ